MSRKYLFILILILPSLNSFSQSFFTSYFVGISNYRGDIGSPAFQPENTHVAVGFGCLYELNDRLLITAGLVNGKVSASDKLALSNQSRNLSFYSNVSEISIGAEYLLFDLYDYKVSPYIFAGIGRFRFNPFTKTKDGQPVNLYERSTEGQGFYQDRKAYKLTQTSLPIGFGTQWALSNKIRVSLSLGARKTFTDYLDDVSTTYIDPSILATHMGSTSVTLAYRGGEVSGNNTYPGDGVQRGNPKNKDWYIFSGLTCRIRLTGKAGRQRNVREDKVSSHRSKVSCPSL